MGLVDLNTNRYHPSREFVAIHGCMYGWMDVCMDVWMDGWMHASMDGCMHMCMCMQLDVCIYICKKKYTKCMGRIVVVM